MVVVMCVHEKNFPLQWLVVSKSQQGAAVFFAKTTQVYQQVLNNRLRSAWLDEIYVKKGTRDLLYDDRVLSCGKVW